MKTLKGLAPYGFASLIAILVAGNAFYQADFYKGKTIKIIRGGGPGGSGEFQTRALMKVLEKHIPGQPRLLMEYVEGAAGRKAAPVSGWEAKPAADPSSWSRRALHIDPDVSIRKTRFARGRVARSIS